MNATFAVLVTAAVGITASAYFSHRRKLRIHGAAWREYNAGAFQPISEPSSDERYDFVTRLAVELATKKGQLAVTMRAPEGWAIQHINKNGTFAKRGPYYTSRYRGSWRPTGRQLLIRAWHGKRGHGFKPDHYNQRGIIWERGETVLEYDTQRYSPLPLDEFVAIQRHRQPKSAG